MAERNLRRILEGTRAALHDSKLSTRYWHLYCALYNFVDVWRSDKTIFELNFKRKFKGLLIPFSPKVYCMPTSKHEEDHRPTLGPRLVPGMFVGYKCCPGGIWRDEYLVIDFDAFE